MAKTYDEVVAMCGSLNTLYEERHLAHRRLRQFWHGRYWDQAKVESDGIASIFRDLTSRQSDIGPDIKLTYNILKDVCVKFQTYLAPVPQIRCYVDPPSTPTRRNQASTKERFLYGTWSANSFNQVLADQGWYLPLMGDAWLGIWPDMNTNMCRVLLRSPEHAYPVMNYDKSCEDAVIFKWKTPISAAKRAFPKWNGPRNNTSPSLLLGWRNKPSVESEVEVLEYSDKNEFQRWVDGQLVTGIVHNFGFDLFEHVKFINVPGEPWGHSAVEQAVNLVEMGNAYLSLMMQSAIENVFPALVIVDPLKAPESIERGAGAVIPVNAGGSVEYLTPPSGSLLSQSEWAANIERMIKTDTSMPDVNFGQADNSIITGKAINELQGAGTGTLVEMVQGVSIGRALSSWNEKAIDISRRMFAKDKIHLYGNESAGIADINPRNFSMTITGSQLVGSTRNEVVFMPYLDMQQKVVIGLQLAGAGLVSRKWQRENVGIPDSEAMDEEIVSETIQGAVLQLLVQSITDPAAAGAVEAEADTFIEGGSMPHPLTQGPSLPGMPPELAGGPPGGLPPGMAQEAGGGVAASPPLNLPPGAPAPVGSPAPPSGPPAPPGAAPNAQGGSIILSAAVSQFQQLQGVTGNIYLVGEIVQTGSTSDTINVDITDASDRDTIAQGVQLPIQIKVITGTPNEPYIDVTPGTSSTATQGQMPSPDEAS